MGKRKYGSLSAHDGQTIELSNMKRSSQACDRCRLKKIKCDGLRPSCTSCKKIGYQCKTSDKLTRRGFPRGYTEMLEREVIKLQRLHGGEGMAPAPAQTSPLPFINDSFHYYVNYTDGETYLGNATWQAVLNGGLEAAVVPSDDASLAQYLDRTFQIDGTGLPAVLARLHGNDIAAARAAARARVSAFVKEHVLVPLLHGNNWKARLKGALAAGRGREEDPTAILAAMYVLQWNYSLFSPEALFNVTKVVVVLSRDGLSALQMLLLATYYFMSLPKQLTTRQTPATAWTIQLVHLAFSQVTAQGLFINYKKLLPVGAADEKGAAARDSAELYETRLLTFWSFQLLSALWSLLQGLPKTNFLADEFHPPSVSSLNIPSLRPFEILLEHILQLDGCNVLQVMQAQNPRYTYVVESFRHTLNHWKLYHNLQDHDLNEITVNNNDRIEIQLTLSYLLPRWLTEQDSPDSHHLSWEILSLYYLLIANEQGSAATASQPPVLKLIHFLPWDNWNLISACFQNLTKAPQDIDRYTYEKYRDLVTNWTHLWYEDDFAYKNAMERFDVKDSERFGKPVNLPQLIRSMRSGPAQNTSNRPLLRPLRSSSNLSTEDPFNMFSSVPPVENLPSQWFLMSPGIDVVSNYTSSANTNAVSVGQTNNSYAAVPPYNYGTVAAVGLNSLITTETFPSLAEDEDGYVEDDENEDDDEGGPITFGMHRRSNPHTLQQAENQALFSHSIPTRKVVARDQVLIGGKAHLGRKNISTDRVSACSPAKDSKLSHARYGLVPDSLGSEATSQGNQLDNPRIQKKTPPNTAPHVNSPSTATPRSLVDLLILPMTTEKTSGDGITTPKEEDTVVRSKA
ncbi:AFR096Wp [Eremothecium gossypii ATCC 10895]|uniref:AFR096Wp n=1 Tax=Eremothecium gossypii (strain ATCC 10895 / CBS 109.51 / FGSC 9923 / NRRL Y-1056) TaxID=284811 RepID=Q754H2_EREGS|nr:AFR096Wp [Eremothecium gossypii ATCC 10895]AAS53467.2 AFR096Wp [Eremothecium gossypii ATCC 10895]AEY97779.1 FAFR096Wp [Eremothecium gossypii FDAG1]